MNKKVFVNINKNMLVCIVLAASLITALFWTGTPVCYCAGIAPICTNFSGMPIN